MKKCINWETKTIQSNRDLLILFPTMLNIGKENYKKMELKAKPHKGKWKDYGLNPKDLRRIYDRMRLKAKEKLSKKHKKEYNQILKKMMMVEYKQIKRRWQNENKYKPQRNKHRTT